MGSKYKGQMAGTFGLASDISFFPAKVLGCLGDAGIVLVSNDNEALYRSIYQIHDHGRDVETGEVERWGRNSRLDNIQAAILSENCAITDPQSPEEGRSQVFTMKDCLREVN